MRLAIPLIVLMLLLGCSSKSSHEEARSQAIVKYGLIASKEDVSVEQARSSTRSNTSVYGSISSGGGVSIGIGIGVLLGSIGSGSSKPQPVRYEIDLVEGGQITIYHESRDFEVGDCVEIAVFEDESKHPPSMRRDKDGCND